jgi:sodium-dependent dicarboxylate transporter 2/3/5
MIAMIGTILLFVLPVDWQKGDFVLHWEDTQKLPWGILLLFGGGISLASSMEKTGLIELIASSVGGEQSLSIFWITALLTIIVLFMTEVMSNVALVTVMIPVVAGLAGSFGENALLMTIPITMAASCAFMLPMATPPNAIVFASGEIEVNQMIKAGIVLNIISVIVIMLIWQFLLPWAFGIELGVMPEWMQNTSKP